MTKKKRKPASGVVGKAKSAAKSKVKLYVAGGVLATIINAMPFFVVILVIAVIAGVGGSDLELSVNAASTAGVPEIGFDSYLEVGRDAHVPWEILAAVAQVETSHGSVVDGTDRTGGALTAFPVAEPAIVVSDSSGDWGGVYLIDVSHADGVDVQNADAAGQLLAAQLLAALDRDPQWVPGASFTGQRDVWVKAIGALTVRGLVSGSSAVAAGFVPAPTTTTTTTTTTTPTTTPTTTDTSTTTTPIISGRGVSPGVSDTTDRTCWNSPVTIYADPTLAELIAAGTPRLGVTVTVIDNLTDLAASVAAAQPTNKTILAFTGDDPNVDLTNPDAGLSSITSAAADATIVAPPFTNPLNDWLIAVTGVLTTNDITAGISPGANRRVSAADGTGIIDLTEWNNQDTSLTSQATPTGMPTTEASPMFADLLLDGACGAPPPGTTNTGPAGTSIEIPSRDLNSINAPIELRITAAYIYEMAAGWATANPIPLCSEFPTSAAQLVGTSPAEVDETLHNGLVLTQPRMDAALVVAKTGLASDIPNAGIVAVTLAFLTDNNLDAANTQTAATSAYETLMRIVGWQQQRLGAVAMTIQGSGDPNIYNLNVTDAKRIAAAALQQAGGDPEQPAAETSRCFGMQIGTPSPQGFVMPKTGWISGPFGPRPPVMGVSGNHPGVDITGRLGDPIWASKAGLVIWAAPRGGYGNAVLIRHDEHTVTLYAHMSVLEVVVDDLVEPGDVIGLTGTTGFSTGPHLHFEVIVDRLPVDPELYLPT